VEPVRRLRTAGEQERPAIPAEVSELIRPVLSRAVEEMISEILVAVPEYARPEDPDYVRLVRSAVEGAIYQFADLVGDPGAPWEGVAAVYREVGAAEAREGRGLESVQTAMRVGVRVAWRRIADEAERLGLPGGTISALAEALLIFLEDISAAAATGFHKARELQAGEWDHRRRRLLELLIAQPPASPQAIADLARMARWPLPRTIAAVALYGEDTEPSGLALPPDVLAGSRGLIVPDPDGPGRRRHLQSSLHKVGAAVGPTVPLTEAAMSLRWARTTADLVQRGLLPAEPLVRATEHLPELLIFTHEELVQRVAEQRLAPLQAVREAHRDSLAETLLAYMHNNFNATEAAARLHVHPQTVRYRINKLQEMFGEQLNDPAIRLEFELVLRLWVSRARGETLPASDVVGQ
jgi:hypothetical protein